MLLRFVKNINRAQEIVQYKFKDTSLLLRAITHPSASELKGLEVSYERLEFLGDSVLGFIIAEEAYKRFPNLSEGKLTKIKVFLVSGTHLSQLARQIGLDRVIIFGSSEAGTGSRGLKAASENVYESIVAALYLDAGIKAAKQFIDKTLLSDLNEDLALDSDNPKTKLQEIMQTYGHTPRYNCIGEDGPPHDRLFSFEVLVDNKSLARGSGKTKKEAQSNAAKNAILFYEKKSSSSRE